MTEAAARVHSVAKRDACASVMVAVGVACGASAGCGGKTAEGLGVGAPELPDSSVSSPPSADAQAEAAVVPKPDCRAEGGESALVVPDVFVLRAAVLLASGQQHPQAIAVDYRNVYWANQGVFVRVGLKEGYWDNQQVVACAIAGCGDRATSLAWGRQLLDTVNIAADGINVYWSDRTPSDGGLPMDGVVRCSSDGCNNQPQMVGPPLGLVALDATNVWTYGSGSVGSCPKAGCSSETFVWDDPTATRPPTAIALDATNVFWADEFTLRTCAKAGCNGPPRDLVTGLAISQIALDADNVYFCDGLSFGTVRSCRKSGCPDGPTVLADKLAWPVSIASDGTDVYWVEMRSDLAGADPGPGRVRKCSVHGCCGSPTDIAVSSNGPIAVAVDDRNVYWAETGTQDGADGRIWMAPK